MHTAICSFEHREVAERARDKLLQAGFQRRDVHLQHRGPTDSDSMGEDPRAWEGTDREVAATREMVDKVAGFVVHLFGAERNEGQRQLYEQAIGRGCTVLVVDTHDAAEAQRARELLHDLQASDLNVYDRSAQPPVRELVDQPQPGSSGGLQGSYQDRSSAWDERAEAQRERALAAGEVGEQRPLDLRDPDLDHVGLRYADKDKDKDKPGR
jgi:hypothetical protein